MEEKTSEKKAVKTEPKEVKADTITFHDYVAVHAMESMMTGLSLSVMTNDDKYYSIISNIANKMADEMTKNRK